MTLLNTTERATEETNVMTSRSTEENVRRFLRRSFDDCYVYVDRNADEHIVAEVVGRSCRDTDLCELLRTLSKVVCSKRIDGVRCLNSTPTITICIEMDAT